jgi:uncharacterized protein
LAAYLYGSTARKKAHKGSDIDIGVLLTELYDPDPLYEARLSAELDRYLGAETDVRVLNCRSLSFLHQVLKHGILLFSRDERPRVGFETGVYSRYLDYKHFYDSFNRTREKRLLA